MILGTFFLKGVQNGNSKFKKQTPRYLTIFMLHSSRDFFERGKHLGVSLYEAWLYDDREGPKLIKYFY